VSPEFWSSLTPPEEPSGFPCGTDQASDQRHLVQREQMCAPEASTELPAYPPLKVAQHPRTQFLKQPLSGKFRSYAEVVGASWKPPSQLPPKLAPPMSQRVRVIFLSPPPPQLSSSERMLWPPLWANPVCKQPAKAHPTVGYQSRA
jgi:hypothetical protein